jgi:hypothetical protein
MREGNEKSKVCSSEQVEEQEPCMLLIDTGVVPNHLD